MSEPAPTASVISSVPELDAFVSSLPPSCRLYIDLEGLQLSRNGNIAIVTILVYPQMVVKLIDITTLGDAAFTTETSTGKSLKAVLEDETVPKCFWDVRNDADALWALYRVRLAGVVDVQLLENASRKGNKTYLTGLDKSISFDLKLDGVEAALISHTKRDIVNQMARNIFAIRPLDPKTVLYCTNDVKYLPRLEAAYLDRISPHWLAKAKFETKLRLERAWSAGYDPQSPTKRYGPWGNGMAYT